MSNETEIEYDCTAISDVCPIEDTIWGAYVSASASLVFVVAYGILMLAQLFLAVRSKTWSYSAWLACGAAVELVGYVGRYLMGLNPWNEIGFLINYVMLIVGPTLIAAAISITFKHIVIWYGAEHSIIPPRWYPWIFVGTDMISIFIQGTGGTIAAISSQDQNMSMTLLGGNLILAGVTFQVVNMVFCAGLIVLVAWRRRQLRKNGPRSLSEDENRSDYMDHAEEKLRIFMWALGIAYFAILVRCIYRVPEQVSGWGSDFMRDETTFLVLDGLMVLAATVILTIIHPCYFFPFLATRGSDRMRGKDGDMFDRAARSSDVPLVQRMSRRGV